MFKKIVFLLAVVCSFNAINAQEIEKKWQLSSSENDFLELQKGSYKLQIATDSINQKGDYLVQDNFIFLFLL